MLSLITAVRKNAKKTKTEETIGFVDSFLRG